MSTASPKQRPASSSTFSATVISVGRAKNKPYAPAASTRPETTSPTRPSGRCKKERLLFSILVDITMTPVKVALEARGTRLPLLGTRAETLVPVGPARRDRLRSERVAGRDAPALR